MALSKQDLADIAAMIAAQQGGGDAPERDAITTKVLDNAPRGKTQSRKAETQSKAASVTRNLDSVRVDVDDKLAFVVAPRIYKNASGTATSSDIRCQPVVQGVRGESVQKSLSLAMLVALRDEEGLLDQLIDAFPAIDKAAKFTSHPVKSAA